jgi:hypothetical protein
MIIVSPELMGDAQALRASGYVEMGTIRLFHERHGMWELVEPQTRTMERYVAAQKGGEFWDGEVWRPGAEWARWWQEQDLNRPPLASH